MKKLIIFLFIISIVAGSVLFVDKSSQIFDVDGVEEVCLVSTQKSEVATESVQCGDKYFNYFSFEDAKREIENLKDVDAVQFYAEEENLEKILKTIKFIELYSEEVEQLEIVYGFSPCYKSAVLLKGKKVNVQIAKIGGRVVLGFPMILTGY